MYVLRQWYEAVAMQTVQAVCFVDDICQELAVPRSCWTRVGLDHKTDCLY